MLINIIKIHSNDLYPLSHKKRNVYFVQVIVMIVYI